MVQSDGCEMQGAKQDAKCRVHNAARQMQLRNAVLRPLFCTLHCYLNILGRMPIADLLQLPVLVFAPLIVFIAYVVMGISGFGSTLIAVPLLAHLLPLKFVVPLVVMLDCAGAFSMGIRLRADLMRRELLWMMPFTAVGVFGGVWLLVQLRPELLLGALGLLVMLFGAGYVIKRGVGIPLPFWTGAPLGTCAGAISSVFGFGGPIYVFFLTGRGATPTQIRATMPVVFMFTTVVRIVLFALAGLYAPASLLAALALLPLLALGLWTGHHLHLNLSRATLVRIIGALLVLSGLSLVVRALLY